ncbi:hypothetical protein DFH28DRAFT_939707 [Melampsora americana]|nr:hypothetical protein DFH28DRAFT_939707 [Melampsora americana]
MAHNNRMPLSMRLNGIIKVDEKVSRSTLEDSILITYHTKVWVNQGNGNGIELLIAARKYDQALKEQHYYRFDGPIISRQSAEGTIFFPEEEFTVGVGPNFIRPVSLADKLNVNSRGIITQMAHHFKGNVLYQNIEVTVLHRHWDPAMKSGRKEEFYTDYIIGPVILLSVCAETLLLGSIFEFRGTLTGFSKTKNRLIVKSNAMESCIHMLSLTNLHVIDIVSVIHKVSDSYCHY